MAAKLRLFFGIAGKAWRMPRWEDSRRSLPSLFARNQILKQIGCLLGVEVGDDPFGHRGYGLGGHLVDLIGLDRHELSLLVFQNDLGVGFGDQESNV